MHGLSLSYTYQDIRINSEFMKEIRGHIGHFRLRRSLVMLGIRFLMEQLCIQYKIAILITGTNFLPIFPHTAVEPMVLQSNALRIDLPTDQ